MTKEQYRIGIIDDDPSKITQMITMIRLCCDDEEGRPLKDKYANYELIPIELALADNTNDMVECIIEERLDAVIIDYKLVGEEGFVDPCTEEYDKHLERLTDGSIAGTTPLGKYMHKTLHLYLKRHAIIHNVDRLRRKMNELADSIAADKLIGKDCSKKEAALQLVTKDFFEYFDMWKEVSEETA